MANADETPNTITIDGVDYDASNLTDAARETLASIQFVDAQVQQLNNEWAIADTARIGYLNALQREMTKTPG